MAELIFIWKTVAYSVTGNMYQCNVSHLNVLIHAIIDIIIITINGNVIIIINNIIYLFIPITVLSLLLSPLSLPVLSLFLLSLLSIHPH